MIADYRAGLRAADRSDHADSPSRAAFDIDYLKGQAYLAAPSQGIDAAQSRVRRRISTGPISRHRYNDCRTDRFADPAIGMGHR